MEWKLYMRIRDSFYRGWIPTFWVLLTEKAAIEKCQELNNQYPEYEYKVAEQKRGGHRWLGSR